MKTAIQKRYENAEVIDDLSGKYDGYTLNHSKEAGYFLSKYVHQKWDGRTWDTIGEDEYFQKTRKSLLPSSITTPRQAALDAIRKVNEKAKFRRFKTFRPVTRDQAIRIWMEGAEDSSGFFDAIREALDKAGIAPLT